MDHRQAMPGCYKPQWNSSTHMQLYYSEHMVALVALSIGVPHRPESKWQNKGEAQHEPRAH